jgi:hypothetical protein
VDTVCDQYLDGVKKVAMPADPRDKVGMLAYVKNAYGKLVTLTKLEIERGQPVPGLADHYLSNYFLRKVHRLLPDEMRSEFLMKMQENGENYYLMKGRAYMDRIISLLRCYYKSLEIALEDRPDLPIMKSGTVRSTGVNVMTTSGYASGQESRSSSELSEEPTQLSVMVTAANAAASRQSANQPASQNQGGGKSKRPDQQAANAGKPKPKYQFAPNVGTGQISYQPKVRGPRWACPVKGHSGHTIAQCRDFWGAENCIERRKLMAETGCYTCLGRDQGCRAGVCAIVKEVPKDTICQECANFTNRTGTPPNILCCSLVFHKKPVVKDAMEVMERWIPDFKASALGVQGSVNWLQINHSLVSNSSADWKDDTAGKSLVYNTQTGKTRAVNPADRVISTPSECACYVVQQLNITSKAATEEATSRPGPPVSFESSNDSAEPDRALRTEPDRSCFVDSRMTTEITTSELHELAGEAAQPDPPPSAPESTVESDVLDTAVATTDQMTSTAARDLDKGACEADSTDTGAVVDAVDDDQFELGVNAEEPDPSPSMPEAATSAAVREIPPRLTVPDPCIPPTVCVDEVPPLDTSGVPLDDVHQPPAVGNPPEPTTVAEAPERDMLLMVASSAPDCPSTPPEPSTGLNDQKIAPVEEVAQGFIAVTLTAADKSPDPQMERMRTPRASGDEDLASWRDVCTKCSTRCGYEDVPLSPPVKEVPGIRPDRAPDELSSSGAAPEGVPHARPSRAPDFPPDRGAPDCGSVARADQPLPTKAVRESRK